MWRALGWCSFVITTLVMVTLATKPFTGTLIMPLAGPLFGVLFVAVISAEDKGAGIAERRLPMLIGNASYSIYLVQFPVMVMLNLTGLPHGLLFGLAQFSLSVLLGIATHWAIENPLLLLMGRKPVSQQAA